MKKIKHIKKWWKKQSGKPITWGDYAKYCKWTLGITAVVYAIIFVGLKIWEHREMKKLENDD